MKSVHKQIKDQVWIQVRDQVEDEVEDQVWYEVEDQVFDQAVFHVCVYDQVIHEVGA